MKTRNILEVQEEIKRCEENKILNNEQKEIRLRILKTYIKVLQSKEEYQKLKISYREKCIQLNKKTEQSIPLKTDLEENIRTLKEYIENTSLVNLLDKNLIKNLDYINLKNATYPYRKGKEHEYEVLSLAIDIYNLINAILENIMKRISTSKENLSKYINTELLEKCSRKEENNHGKKTVKIKAKNIPEYMACRDIAYMKLDQMLEEDKINQLIYDCGMTIINEIFNYYIDGLDEITIAPASKKEKLFVKKND
ncbi:MAG: hypothetical protein HFJ38_03885 [Bacilli bacterium]|nr:hypothetical protein [Bacilli bacterium]